MPEFTSPHQKCDAKQPCTACVTWDKGVRCTYEPWKRPRPTGAKALPVLQRNGTSGPPSTRGSSSKTLTDGFPEPPKNPPSGLLLTWPGPGESVPSLTPSLPSYEQPSTQTARLPWELSPRIYNKLVFEPLSDVSAAQKLRGATECVPSLSFSYFTVLPSIYFSIPRPLRVPLSFFSPEHVQVSSVAGNDLDMI